MDEGTGGMVATFKEDFARAAGLTEGEPGYLHVAENSASKPRLNCARVLYWMLG